MNWYMMALKKYAQFDGRSRRSEYWFFLLFNFIIAFALGFIEGMLGSPGIVGGIYSLGVLIPGIAVTVRRLHDTGRGGPWIFVALVPVIGALVLLFFMAQDSESGSNKFGENPKG